MNKKGAGERKWRKSKGVPVSSSEGGRTTVRVWGASVYQAVARIQF